MPKMVNVDIERIALVRKTHKPVQPEAVIEVVKAMDAVEPGVAERFWKEGLVGVFGDILRQALHGQDVSKAEQAPADDVEKAGWLPEGTTQGDLDDGDFAWLADDKDLPDSKRRKLPYKIHGKVDEAGWKAAWSRAHQEGTDFSGGPSQEQVIAKLKADKPDGVELDEDGKKDGEAKKAQGQPAAVLDYRTRVELPVSKAVRKAWGSPEGSYEERTGLVCDAIQDAYGGWPCIIGTWDDHVLYQVYQNFDGDYDDDDYKTYSVPYTLADGTVRLGAREEVNVETSYTPVAKANAGAAVAASARGHVDNMSREANDFIRKLEATAKGEPATSDDVDSAGERSARNQAEGDSTPDLDEPMRSGDGKGKGMQGMDEVLKAIQGLDAKVEQALAAAGAAQQVVARLDVQKAVADALAEHQRADDAAFEQEVSKARQDPTPPIMLGSRRPGAAKQAPSVEGMSFGEAVRVLTHSG